jgi:hypothetical protein
VARRDTHHQAAQKQQSPPNHDDITSIAQSVKKLAKDTKN